MAAFFFMSLDLEILFDLSATLVAGDFDFDGDFAGDFPGDFAAGLGGDDDLEAGLATAFGGDYDLAGLATALGGDCDLVAGLATAGLATAGLAMGAGLTGGTYSSSASAVAVSLSVSLMALDSSIEVAIRAARTNAWYLICQIKNYYRTTFNNL